jgi:hypothetical protein
MIVGITIDEAAGGSASFHFQQDSGGTESSTFNGTYSSPSAIPSSPARIGANTDDTEFFVNGTRLYSKMVFSQALTLSQMTNIANTVGSRYY